MSDLSNDATDDGFHEIQLSGKQLVFLFMATTVVSVVIFLCGVLVGRGVRGEALANAPKPAMSTAGAQPTSEVTPPTAVVPPQVAEGAAQPGADPLTYNKRLTEEKAVSETLKPPKAAETTEAIVTPAPAPQPAPTATADPAAKTATPKGTASTPVPPPQPQVQPPAPLATPARGVWAVQVVALTDKTAAQAVVDRLVGKGYPAFLVAPQANAAVKNYKVQVGRFEDRSEAQGVSSRLKKEEQFEPWILR